MRFIVDEICGVKMLMVFDLKDGSTIKSAVGSFCHMSHTHDPAHMYGLTWSVSRFNGGHRVCLGRKLLLTLV
jgi:hypothetical protein